VATKTVPAGPAGKQFMTTLWIHETFRVFYDRLTEHADNEWMITLLKRLLPQHFEVRRRTKWATSSHRRRLKSSPFFRLGLGVRRVA